MHSVWFGYRSFDWILGGRISDSCVHGYFLLISSLRAIRFHIGLALAAYIVDVYLNIRGSYNASIQPYTPDREATESILYTMFE